MDYFVGILSLFALLLFLCKYKKFGGKSIGFPLYFYIAMFPYKLRALPVFAYDDVVLKCLLICDLLFVLIKRKKVRVNYYEIGILCAVVLSDLASIISGSVTDKSLMVTGMINILFMFMFTMAFRTRVVSPDGFRTVGTIFTCNAIILSIAAVIEVIKYQALRAELGLNNPNYLAFYLAISLCLQLHFARGRKYSVRKYVAAVIIVIGIVCTGSFSILLCISIYLVLNIMYSMIQEKKRFHTTRIILICITVIVPVIIWLSTVDGLKQLPIVGQLLSNKDSERIYIWVNAIGDWLQKPILGWGYNCWRSHYSIGYVTHNDFIRLLVETGIFGVIMFLLFWLNAAKKIRKGNGRNQPMYISLAITVVVFSCFHNNINSILFWIMLELPQFDDIITGSLCNPRTPWRRHDMNSTDTARYQEPSQSQKTQPPAY